LTDGPAAGDGAARERQVTDLFQEHALSPVQLTVLLTGDRASAEDLVQDAFLGCCRLCRGCAPPTRRWHTCASAC
jgi:DNA-directed RNA polymerase specialized sigma24 family protein